MVEIRMRYFFLKKISQGTTAAAPIAYERPKKVRQGLKYSCKKYGRGFILVHIA